MKLRRRSKTGTRARNRIEVGEPREKEAAAREAEARNRVKEEGEAQQASYIHARETTPRKRTA